MIYWKLAIFFLAMSGFANPQILIAEDPVAVRIQVNDEDQRQLPCRIHLRDSGGNPVRAEKLPFWRDHFVCDGRVDLTLPGGNYHIEIERGPEYARQVKDLTISGKKREVFEFKLPRLTHLREAGWYSGDMHVHRPVDEVPLLMKAEDLDFAPTITWWNARNPWTDHPVPSDVERTVDGKRIYTVMAGEDEREGGALLFFGLEKPIDITSESREFPSPMKFVNAAHVQNPHVWIDIEKPFWWDVATWLASGQMDSIGLANNHMCRSQMYENEAWGRPRDVNRLPNPRGNGMWTQEIYYHILNSGIRISPSAGSASGVLPNPVGYNRIYAHLDGPLTSQSWFEAVRGGRTFVTNGPLLVVRANSELPGTAFKLNDSGKLDIEFSVALSSNDIVPKLEVISQGKVIKEVECSREPSQDFTFAISIDQPGWFLVRAVTDVEHTYRFASTAPWFVESVTGEIPIHKSSARFFKNWVEERIDRVRANLSDADQLRAILEPHEAALVFWTERQQQAVVD